MKQQDMDGVAYTNRGVWEDWAQRKNKWTVRNVRERDAPRGNRRNQSRKRRERDRLTICELAVISWGKEEK